MFAKELVKANHTIQKIFFYGPSTAIGLETKSVVANGGQSANDWINVARANQTELILCISSALQEGIVDEREAKRFEEISSNIAVGFQLGGLGHLIEAINDSERLLTFGG